MSTDKCRHGVELSTICNECDDEICEQAKCSFAGPTGSETANRLRRLRHWAIKAACVAVLTTTVSTGLCGVAIWLGLMDIEVAKGTIAGTTVGILLGDLVTSKWKSPNK